MCKIMLILEIHLDYGSRTDGAKPDIGQSSGGSEGVVSRMDGWNVFYDPVWHCEGLVGSGNAWANEMIFWMKHAQQAGLIARPVAL